MKPGVTTRRRRRGGVGRARRSNLRARQSGHRGRRRRRGCEARPFRRRHLRARGRGRAVPDLRRGTHSSPSSRQRTGRKDLTLPTLPRARWPGRVRVPGPRDAVASGGEIAARCGRSKTCECPIRCLLPGALLVALLAAPRLLAAETSVPRGRALELPSYDSVQGLAPYGSREAYAAAAADRRFVIERIRYPSDGLTVLAYVYRPVASSGRLPVIVFNAGAGPGSPSTPSCW